MNIESISFYDCGGNIIPYSDPSLVSVCYQSVYEVACNVMKYLYNVNVQNRFGEHHAIVWLDNGRIVNVSRQSYTVIYHRQWSETDLSRMDIHCKLETLF